MATEPPVRTTYLYLAAVVVLSLGAIAMMAALFVSGFHAFLTTLFRDPGYAIRSDPLSVVLFVGALLLVVLLFALVVAVGVQHAPPPTDRSDE